MPRYIDADWIVQKLEEWRDQLVETCGENDEYVLCLSEVLMKLDDTPTADVVEVGRHRKERVVDTLKPCPFCGGDNAEIRTDDNGISWYIFCNDCGLIAGYSMTKVDLAKIWNRRAKDE